MQKRIDARLGEKQKTAGPPWLGLDDFAEVLLTSESPAHPVEAALAPPSSSEAVLGWRAAEPGPQRIRLRLREARRVRRVRLVCEEGEHARTQELVLRVERSGAGSFVDVVRQQFTFSPPGTVREVEEFVLGLEDVAALEIEITPQIGGGSSVASLREFRVE